MIVNKYINYVYLIGDSINKIMRKSMTRNDRIHSIKYDKGKKHYWNSSHRDYGIVSNFSLHQQQTNGDKYHYGPYNRRSLTIDTEYDDDNNMYENYTDVKSLQKSRISKKGLGKL